METSAKDTVRVCIWELFEECSCNNIEERNACIPAKLWRTCGLPIKPKLLDIWIPEKLASLL